MDNAGLQKLRDSFSRRIALRPLNILAEKRNSVYLKLLYKLKNVKGLQNYYYIRAL